MRTWTVTIEDNQGEGLEYTYKVRAETVLDAAAAAQAECDMNYTNMEVTSIEMDW